MSVRLRDAPLSVVGAAVLSHRETATVMAPSLPEGEGWMAHSPTLSGSAYSRVPSIRWLLPVIILIGVSVLASSAGIVAEFVVGKISNWLNQANAARHRH
jgi:hypothetical protein